MLWNGFLASSSISIFSTCSEHEAAPVSIRAANGRPELASVSVAVAPMMCFSGLDTDLTAGVGECQYCCARGKQDRCAAGTDGI